MDPDPSPGAEPVSQRRARLVLALGLSLIGLWILRDFLPALAWAVVLSIALWPLYDRLLQLCPSQRGRIAVPLLLTLLVGIVFVAPLVLLGVALVKESHIFIAFVGTARHEGIIVPDWLGQVPVVGPTLADWWQANLSDPVTAEALFGRLNPRVIAESAREYGGEIIRRLVTFLFTLLTLFFLFRDGSRLSEDLRTASDRVMGARGERIGRHMIAAVHGTVVGLVLVGLAEGAVLGIVYVAVDLPYPLLVGTGTGVAAIIPFGAPLVYGLATLYMLAIGKTLAAVIIFVAGNIVVFVADHFIRPVLFGGSTRLPFLWVLFGLLGGLETMGFIGLFVGPAVMAALIALWREWTGSPEPAARDRRSPARRPASGAALRRQS
jgi:predicted PurR-regulated permease PerM